ncbi:MAG: pyridine nucleotide-disulfide oxidoreductase, partial [Clostridia bacterium]|nr:pyridine nucleotide-disulfide oxidoreductase [Clostridia bacterium]
PTRITEQEDVTVYFRVADVYRNACLTVSLDGEEMIKKKKPKLAPGEMETVTIPVSVIKRADGKTLTLAIKQ